MRVLAGGAERAGWGRWARWQRKPNVLVVEDDRVGGGRQMLWQCGGKRFGRGRQVLFAVENVRAGRGRQVLWQRKTGTFDHEDERACCGRSMSFMRT